MIGLSRRLSTVERLLLLAERRIALLARCQPKNGASEQARLRELLQQGRLERPRFTYQAVPDLSELRAQLVEAAAALADSGALWELYAERARELALETRLVESIGTNAFAGLAAQRFQSRNPEEDDSAARTAEEWAECQGDVSGLLVASDDAGDARSLYCRLHSEIGRLRLPFRVETCAMSAAAATGDGVILVARARMLSLRATERIVAHEVYGHALPRQRAAREREPLFALGSARGNDEQEGYALYLEARDRHLDDARKRELGLRHLAAVSVHQGADWVETTRQLLARSASTAEAVAIASRAHRAGGLAREFVYLPALERVTAAANRDAVVLDWLARGRLDLQAIAVLRTNGDEPLLAAPSTPG